VVEVVDRDWLVRLHAFRFLEDLVAEHGDPLPWKPLYEGFEFGPDHVLEIRAEILEERDGPMLRHGLQSLHGARLMQLPRRVEERPDRRRLEERCEQFRAG
jgi:hypothetical protein